MTEIAQRLQALSDETRLKRIDEDNPTCSGCGRRCYSSDLQYAVQLVNGTIVLACADCGDNDTERVLHGETFEQFCGDLPHNWRPLFDKNSWPTKWLGQDIINHPWENL